MYWVVVASDWSGSIVQVLGDEDSLPGGEWRDRTVLRTPDRDVALRVADQERRRILAEP
jgi:hypothetical protein